jgi:hypothetical protein
LSSKPVNMPELSDWSFHRPARWRSQLRQKTRFACQSRFFNAQQRELEFSWSRNQAF